MSEPRSHIALYAITDSISCKAVIATLKTLEPELSGIAIPKKIWEEIKQAQGFHMKGRFTTVDDIHVMRGTTIPHEILTRPVYDWKRGSNHRWLDK